MHFANITITVALRRNFNVFHHNKGEGGKSWPNGVSGTWITSSGFGLGQISPYDKLFADLNLLWLSPRRRDFVGAGEIAEYEGTPRFTVLFLAKFPFNVRKRGFASSWSFSKRFKERKQRSLQIQLSTFTLERGISNIPQILFRRSETFPFNFVLLHESFSLKPHKTQLLFVALNLVGITSMVSIVCMPSIWSRFSQINKLIWQPRVC